MTVRAMRQHQTATPAAVIPPIWREAFWPADWLSLRHSAVYQGYGVPRGDGGPVVVVPGFLCSDAMMYEMYAWLGRIGYRPYLSGIGPNVDCPSATSGRLAVTVERAHVETSRRVRIVGHSLGGIVGRRVALAVPEMVSQLVFLGSPIRGVHAHPAIVATAAVLAASRSLIGADHCIRAGCSCRFGEDESGALPGHIHHAAIYTRSDGVVDWHEAQEPDAARNH